MVGVPIACSLQPGQVGPRLAEWRSFLDAHVEEVVRAAASARLRLREGIEPLLIAGDLARREKSCCAFFDFRLVRLADGTWLEIEAPVDAEPALQALIDRPIEAPTTPGAQRRPIAPRARD